MPVCTDSSIPNHITLTFSSMTIGDHLSKLVSVPSRGNELSRVFNFWAPRAILDGRYPALIWEHNFVVFDSGITRWDFAKKFFTLASSTSLYGPNAQSLQVTVSGTTAIDFGSCYLQSHTVESPDNLIGYGAGLYSLKFIGTDIPTVLITTPTP